MITVNNVKPDQTDPLDLGVLYLFRLSVRIFRVNKVSLPGDLSFYINLSTRISSYTGH